MLREYIVYSAVNDKCTCDISRAAGKAVRHLPVLDQHSFRDARLKQLLAFSHGSAAPHGFQALSELILSLAALLLSKTLGLRKQFSAQPSRSQIYLMWLSRSTAFMSK